MSEFHDEVPELIHDDLIGTMDFFGEPVGHQRMNKSVAIPNVTESIRIHERFPCNHATLELHGRWFTFHRVCVCVRVGTCMKQTSIRTTDIHARRENVSAVMNRTRPLVSMKVSASTRVFLLFNSENELTHFESK